MDISKLPVLLLRMLPKVLIKPIAFRYVAGEAVEDAVRRVEELNKLGITATLDVLGEAAESMEDIQRYLNEYKKLISIIAEKSLKSGISIKPTAFGMLESPATAENNIKEVILAAKEHNIFVRIDMEDSPYTTDIINIYRKMRKIYSRVGLVLQAYLYRTMEDIDQLTRQQGEDGICDIRLCKGIYKEAPDIAIKGYHKINENFLCCLDKMFAEKYKLGVATHDYPLIDGAKEIVTKKNISKDTFEFQMLYGVRTSVAKKLVEQGYRVRIYVPYGKDWYPYSMRRMYENPLIAFHVAKAVTWDIFKYIFMLR